MEVFWQGKEKLKKSNMGFEAYRHHFTAELDDGDSLPFHVDEPDYLSIHLDVKIVSPKGHILFGTAVMDGKEFIEKTVKDNMKNLKKAT